MAAQYDTMHRGRSSEMRSLLVSRIYIPRQRKIRREVFVLFREVREDTITLRDDQSKTCTFPVVYDRRKTDGDFYSRNHTGSDSYLEIEDFFSHYHFELLHI